MKKLFVVLSLFALVGFVTVPAHALVGVPDAVPGTEVVLPFFLIEKTGTYPDPVCGLGDNTLLTITEVGGVESSVHFTVYNKRTEDLFNDTIDYTPNDVLPILISDIINDMSDILQERLEIDFRGKTYYFGYIVFDQGTATPDNLIAHLYQLDLAGGLAAGVVIPAKESANGLNSLLQDDRAVGKPDLEAFNADAYFAAEQLIAEDTPPGASGWFRLMPRYYLNDEATGECYIIIWASKNDQPGEIHIYIYDEEENKRSITIIIEDEVNLLNVEGILPQSFKYSGETPFAAGWIAIDLPDLNGDGFNGEVEYLAYSWQMAYDILVGTNWSVLFDVHRDAGTTD